MMGKTRYRRIARLRSGSLAKLPFGQLLHAFAAEKRTLCFEIRRRHIRKTIVIEDGSPVDCRSNLVHETLGRHLVSRGRLSDFQCQESVARAAERGLRTGEAMIELGLIDEAALRAALQASLASKLLECFTWRDGDFRVMSELPADELEMVAEINVAQLLFTGISRFSPAARVRQGIGAVIGKELILASTPAIALDAIELSAPQQRLVNRLRSPIPAEDLLRNREMSKAELIRMLYTLSVMGLVVRAPREGIAQVEVPVEVPVEQALEEALEAPPVQDALPTVELIDLAESGVLEEPPKLDAEPSTQDSNERLRQAITREHAHFRNLDPREILARAPDHRQRYIELCERYAPLRFEAPELAEVANLAAELLSLTVRGYAALQESTELEPRIVSVSDLDPEDQAELATEYSEQGGEQLSSGNFAAATDLLGLAADCEPENMAHSVELAYARYRKDAEYARESLDELLRLSRQGYSNPLIYLYCAEISSSLGDAEAAATFFHTGCEFWNGLLTYR